MTDTKTPETKTPTREEILVTSLHAREQEIMHYQLNIDNYTIALDEIADLPMAERTELAEFRDQLRNLLVSETLEQKKAKIMYTVIKRQIKV